MTGPSTPPELNAEAHIEPDDGEIELSIIIPAFNEALRIGATLDRISQWLSEMSVRAELIIVDDGSDDATFAVVQAHQTEHPHIVALTYAPNRGKGYAVSQGVKAARGAWILFTDADLSMPIEGYAQFRRAIETSQRDVSIAIASRVIAGSSVDVKPPAHRKAMGRVFNAVVKATVLPGITDSQCGFKLFRAEAAKTLFARRTIDGFAFDAEILFLARKQGIGYVEVPVHWSHNQNSRILPVRDSLKMFASIISIPMRHRKKGRLK